jgi:hypothetical protein
MTISVRYDEGEKDYFAVPDDDSGESWVIQGAKNQQQAEAMVKAEYPDAEIG